jgi:hypothetical protein
MVLAEVHGIPWAEIGSDKHAEEASWGEGQDPEPDQKEGGPIRMMNLLKFREFAKYSDGTETGLSGACNQRSHFGLIQATH